MNCYKFMFKIIKDMKQIHIYNLFKICLKGYDAVEVNRVFNKIIAYNDKVLFKDGVVKYNG